MSDTDCLTPQSEKTRCSTGLALLGALIGLAVGLILAWIYLLQQREERSRVSPSPPVEERIPLEPGLHIAQGEAPATPAVAEPAPDDLTRVEGIGPKISSLLHEAGIVSFGQLAASDPDELRRILREEGLPFVDPGTWPEQAALAAAGA